MARMEVFPVPVGRLTSAGRILSDKNHRNKHSCQGKGAFPVRASNLFAKSSVHSVLAGNVTIGRSLHFSDCTQSDIKRKGVPDANAVWPRTLADILDVQNYRALR
jgi:hypothetical protein